MPGACDELGRRYAERLPLLEQLAENLERELRGQFADQPIDRLTSIEWQRQP